MPLLICVGIEQPTNIYRAYVTPMSLTMFSKQKHLNCNMLLMSSMTWVENMIFVAAHKETLTSDIHNKKHWLCKS